MRQKSVCYDWATTLADESEIDKLVCKSMEAGFAKNNNKTLEVAEDFFKKHLQSLESTWKWHDYILHGKVLGVDWKLHQELNLGSLALLPGAREVLEYAREKNYKNVLATNAVRPVIELRVKYVGLTDLLDLIVASDDVKALKSEGKHFEHALKVLDIDPLQSFSVGDNPVQDILPAKKLGFKTIYCNFGESLTYYHTDHLSNNHRVVPNADYTISNLLEIKDIIK